MGPGDSVEEPARDPTPEERVKTHEALVKVGDDAVLAIERFIQSTDMTMTLRQELLTIASEIKGVEIEGENAVVPD